MKELKLETRVEVYAVGELDNIYRQLYEAAFEASKKAYAPYSKFHVGAAVLLENGEILSGNNQENAAYPSGLCAERTTLFYAGARYPDAVKIFKLVFHDFCAYFNTLVTDINALWTSYELSYLILRFITK